MKNAQITNIRAAKVLITKLLTHIRTEKVNSRWSIVAGGFFPSLWNHTPINDIDIYVLNPVAGSLLYNSKNVIMPMDKASFLIDSIFPGISNIINSIHFVEGAPYDAVLNGNKNILQNISFNYSTSVDITSSFINYLTESNHNLDLVTYSNGISTELKIQIIFTDYNNRRSLINNFDLVHAMSSYSYYENKLWTSEYIMNTVFEKKLIRNTLCPYSTSEHRIKKLVERGWKNETGLYI